MSCYTNHTTWTPYDAITESGAARRLQPGPVTDVLSPVYWHVRAIDAPRGVLGAWSNSATADTWRFVRDPSGVTQLTPTQAQAVSTPVLSWTPKAGSTDVPGRDPEIEQDDGGRWNSGRHLRDVVHADGRLDPADGPFYWYVQAIDGNGVASPAPANPTRSFTIVAPDDGHSRSIS